MNFATTEYEVQLVPLPHWKHRPFEEYRNHVAEIIHEIESETRNRQYDNRTCVLGPRKILREDPHKRPATMKQSPAPLFHTATARMAAVLRQAYAWFLKAYRIAAEKLKHGDLEAVFPEGCFPPALPFVPG